MSTLKDTIKIFLSKLAVIFLLSKSAMIYLGLTKDEGKFYCDFVFYLGLGCFLILALINYFVLSDPLIEGIMAIFSWVIIFLCIAVIISLFPTKTILCIRKMIKRR